MLVLPVEEELYFKSSQFHGGKKAKVLKNTFLLIIERFIRVLGHYFFFLPSKFKNSINGHRFKFKFNDIACLLLVYCIKIQKIGP